MTRCEVLSNNEKERLFPKISIVNNVEHNERKKLYSKKNKYEDNTNDKIESNNKCEKSRGDAIKVDCGKLKLLRKSFEMHTCKGNGATHVSVALEHGKVL